MDQATLRFWRENLLVARRSGADEGVRQLREGGGGELWLRNVNLPYDVI